jgi:hypothetical protein
MRQIAGLLMILAPLSCSYQARWNATCDISFSLICSRQVSCGQAFEQSQCEQDLRQQLYCDPSADLDTLKACRAAATDQSNCDEAIPEVCLSAMCDATMGCRTTDTAMINPCDPGYHQENEGGICVPDETGDTGPY